MLAGDGLVGEHASELDLASQTATLTGSTIEASSGALQVVAQVQGSVGTVSGELRQWHKVTVDFEGPVTSETATPNPFTDYRLDVTFTNATSGKTYVVPGYYAADGNAANSSDGVGNVWRVHFAPDETGEWLYTASFRTGTNVAVSEQADPGTSGGFFDGAMGVFTVSDTDKTGRDFRGTGRLEYVGERYLQFAGNGEYFLKQGADSPENLLAYDEFDGPFASDGQGDGFVKDWAPHVADWNPGDPTWGNEKGKGLIGAVNYLASEGQNAFSFLPMNIGGDDKNVFPYLDYNERLRLDVSRLAQWEVVFEHADHQGMFLHFKTQETENDQLLDGGNLGTQRKLYYRELIARFGHHLALNWNLGEEITNTTAQIQDFAQYFRDVDPYDHHIVAHTFPGQQDQRYDPLLGTASELTGASLQTNFDDFRRVHDDTARWVRESAAAGKPWAIAVDEPGDAQHALRPDNDRGNSHEDGRKNALWGTLMAGGWGNEYYFGYGHNNSDLTLQDFRSRDEWWDTTRYALEFFQQNDIPFWEMRNDNTISSATDDYGFYKAGDTYTVYLKNGGTTNLDLSDATGTYDVRWFDPRNGGGLQGGSVNTVAGGGSANLGTAPNSVNQDWAILVQRRTSTGPNEAPIVSIPGAEPAAAGEGEVFQEQNGLVVIEMESQPATGGWQQQTDVAGFTGDGYYRWEGPDLFGNPGAQGVTAYKINVTNSGTYQMRFRNHRDGGIPFDQQNDVWTRMDSGAWAKVFSGTQGQWNWASNFDFGEGNRPAASYQLAAGEHTFYISGRSNGFRIDRVAFYNTALTSAGTAQNVTTPQSPTNGVVDELTFDLTGQALDDGLVLQTPLLQWSLDAGAGTAVFSAPTNRNTQVTFSQPGVYRVKLLAYDGEFVSSAARVIVAPAVEPPSNQVIFTPIDDATVQGTVGINDGVIKVQTSGPTRTGYYKFDVTGLTPTEIASATLRLTVSQDAGSGTLNLRTGTTNAWAEETINAANAPAAGAVIDSVSGTHAVGAVREFDVDSVVTANGTYSFVLQHGGGNDVWFSSKEGSTAPQLVITRPDLSLAGDYDRNGTVDQSDKTFWQFSYGSTIGDGLQADGNEDGVVNALDYSIWRDAFDAASSAIALVTTTRDASADETSTEPRQPRETTPLSRTRGSFQPAARSTFAARRTDDAFAAPARIHSGDSNQALLLIEASSKATASEAEATSNPQEREHSETQVDEAFADLVGEDFDSSEEL